MSIRCPAMAWATGEYACPLGAGGPVGRAASSHTTLLLSRAATAGEGVGARSARSLVAFIAADLDRLGVALVPGSLPAAKRRFGPAKCRNVHGRAGWHLSGTLSVEDSGDGRACPSAARPPPVAL